MDKKSAKIIDSNLRNVTKALKVIKNATCAPSGNLLQYSEIRNVIKHDMPPKWVFAKKKMGNV